jgi:hypothetical protein
MTCFNGELADTHPPFPATSNAVCVDKYDPNVKTIEYSAEDDKILEQWLREKIGTCWHSLYDSSVRFGLIVRGTAAMKQEKDGGVVDKDLNVYGTRNLKVAGKGFGLWVC